MVGGAYAASWAVRNPRSSVFAPSVWHGEKGRRAVALTFDDGPSPSTPSILEILKQYSVKATFFLVGRNTLAQPDIARECLRQGHDLANHSHTHPNFALKSSSFVMDEFEQAQRAIVETTGVTPCFLRAPYGVRWFGFAAAQRRLSLRGVMWSVIGRDWRLPAAEVEARILNHAKDGDIICLHDGRDIQAAPDVTSTVEAVRKIVPTLLERGYHFETVSEILCPMK